MMLEKAFPKRFLPELFIFSGLVAAIHYFALIYDLYWIIDWFDMFVHFIGGAAIGFLGVFIFFTSGYIQSIANLKGNKIVVFSFIFMFTAVIALVWEIWELFFGISDILIDKNDTLTDLIMGMLGSTFTFTYVKNKINK